MGMKTELDMQAQVVIGGEKIAVHKWQLANQHLQQFAHVLSRLQMAILEMDSNNTTGQMIYADSEAINSDLKRAEIEWAFTKKYRNLEPAAQEKVLTVLVITDNEQLRTVNVKCRRVVNAISTMLQKIVFSDSAKLQYGVGDRDIRKFETHWTYIKDVVLTYIGSGELDGEKANVGIDVAAHEHLGNVVPPINLHEAQVYEPSPDAPLVPSPDVQDRDSTIPAPGSNTQPGS